MVVMIACKSSACVACGGAAAELVYRAVTSIVAGKLTGCSDGHPHHRSVLLDVHVSARQPSELTPPQVHDQH
jgi:hypothetical protein